jgi:hypothetical protein
MTQKRIKSSIYYPVELYNAINKLVEKNKLGKSFNQIVLEILARDKEIIELLDKENN